LSGPARANDEEMTTARLVRPFPILSLERLSTFRRYQHQYRLISLQRQDFYSYHYHIRIRIRHYTNPNPNQSICTQNTPEPLNTLHYANDIIMQKRSFRMTHGLSITTVCQKPTANARLSLYLSLSLSFVPNTPASKSQCTSSSASHPATP